MKNTAKIKIPAVLWYFSGLLLVFGILFYLASALYPLGSITLKNVDWGYKNQIIDTIPVFVPSLIGYLLLRIVDFFLFKKNIISALKTAVLKSLSKAGYKILIGMLFFFSALLISFIIMGTYFALIYLLGWTRMNNYPNSGMNFFEKLVNCLFTSIREEFLFRFFLMSAFAFGINLVANKKVSISSSLIITSILFGISHFRIVQERTFSWYLFLFDVSAGVVLGTAYILTKSLYFSLGFHLGWNYFLGAIPVLGSFSIYNPPNWNNLLAILIILVIMTPVYYCSRTFLKLNTHWLW